MSRSPESFPYRRVQPLDYAPGAVSVASFMNAVYAWMCVGLAVTAAVAWWVAGSPSLLRSIFSPLTFIILIVAELGLVFAISGAINRISATAATALFLLYSALNGLTLSIILLAYAQATVFAAFLSSAGMFGAMSLLGWVTRMDLTRLGGILFMALIGLIIATVVNIFWANGTLFWLINYAGVVIFMGLTAYDTQKLKQLAQQSGGNPTMTGRLSIVGSLTLYLDFINLFLFMLRILGSRRN